MWLFINFRFYGDNYWNIRTRNAKSGADITAWAQLHAVYENIFRKYAITNVGSAQISVITSNKYNMYRILFN
jgi:hypothetical protein